METQIKDAIVDQLRSEMDYDADVVSLYIPKVDICCPLVTDITATIVINGVCIKKIPFVMIHKEDGLCIKHHINRNYIEYCLIVSRDMSRYYTAIPGISLKSIKYPETMYSLKAAFNVFGVKIGHVRIYYDTHRLVYCEQVDAKLREAILEHILDEYCSVRDEPLLKQFITHMDPDYSRTIPRMRIARDIMHIAHITVSQLNTYNTLIRERVRNDAHEMFVKEQTPRIRGIMTNIYLPDMKYFRNVDQFCTLSSYHRRLCPDLLLCGKKGDKTVLCPSRRMVHYLGHTEPHFRNILFALFRFEITSLLSPSEYCDIVHDIRRTILMNYIMSVLFV